MPKTKKQKFYMVISQKNNYTYGAFPYTKQGKEDAKAYIENKSNKNLKLVLKVK
jgi:hypothetical protein